MNFGLDKITTNAGTQARAKISQATIDNYAEAMLAGAKFPPVTLFGDGINIYLADGFHRYFAAKKIGAPNIEAVLHEGTLRDAILHSLRANFNHGLQRTNEDKRKAVTIMLEDFEWESWSDREIAKHCEVGHTLVSKLRKELGLNKEVTKFERDGKVIEMSKPIKPNKKEEDKLPDEYLSASTDVEKEKLIHAVDLLQAENQELTDKLAVATVSPEVAERDMAQSLIADLRSQIKFLKIELDAVKQSRDTYQSEKAQLMKQNAMLQKKLKKYESGE